MEKRNDSFLDVSADAINLSKRISEQDKPKVIASVEGLYDKFDYVVREIVLKGGGPAEFQAVLDVVKGFEHVIDDIDQPLLNVDALSMETKAKIRSAQLQI